MSFIDKLKSLIGINTNNVTTESPANMEIAPTPVVEEVPAPVENVSPEVEAVINQVDVDLESISTDVTTEGN